METTIVLSPTSFLPFFPVDSIVTAWSPAGSGFSGSATHLPRSSAFTVARGPSWVAMVTDAPGSALPAITVSPSSFMRTTSSCGADGNLSGSAAGAAAGVPAASGASADGAVSGAVAVCAGGAGSVSSNRSGYAPRHKA